MRDFAQKSGGQLYSPVKPEELQQAYTEIAEELKNQYLITYVPNNERHDGNFRAVTVALTRPGLVVNAKAGYLAPKEQ